MNDHNRILRIENDLKILDTFLTEMVGDQLEIERRLYQLEHKPSTIIKRASK